MEKFHPELNPEYPQEYTPKPSSYDGIGVEAGTGEAVFHPVTTGPNGGLSGWELDENGRPTRVWSTVPTPCVGEDGLANALIRAYGKSRKSSSEK